MFAGRQISPFQHCLASLVLLPLICAYSFTSDEQPDIDAQPPILVHGPICVWHSNPQKECSIVWIERPESKSKNWFEAKAGFGYGDDDDETVLKMRGKHRAVYIRRAFELTDSTRIDALDLDVLYDEFFALFLDPSRTYSCAYFREEDMTLEQAQIAKVELSLSKCDLQPGQKILDIGCGWGTAAISAAENYDVDAIGITLSENQHEYASSRKVNSERKVEFRLQGWEEFSEPVDRIVSIGAFEPVSYTHLTLPTICSV